MSFEMVSWNPKFSQDQAIIGKFVSTSANAIPLLQ